MGQAKNRGSFEQRKIEAIEKRKKEMEQRKIDRQNRKHVTGASLSKLCLISALVSASMLK